MDRNTRAGRFKCPPRVLLLLAMSLAASEIVRAPVASAQPRGCASDECIAPSARALPEDWLTQCDGRFMQGVLMAGTGTGGALMGALLLSSRGEDAGPLFSDPFTIAYDVIGATLFVAGTASAVAGAVVLVRCDRRRSKASAGLHVEYRKVVVRVPL